MDRYSRVLAFKKCYFVTQLGTSDTEEQYCIFYLFLRIGRVKTGKSYRGEGDAVKIAETPFPHNFHANCICHEAGE